MLVVASMKKLSLIALMCMAALAAEPKIAGGPYVINVTSKTATIAWLVADNDVTVQPPGGVAAIQSSAFRVEKTTLTGLMPDTRYEYQVPGITGAQASLQDSGHGSDTLHLRGLWR